MLSSSDMTNVADEAAHYAKLGCSCSQAIAYSFSRYCGLDRKLFLGLSSGLAGGMGGAGETCGVVSTAIVILGATFGPRTPNDVVRRGDVMQLSSEFVERFNCAHGSTLCQDLSGGANLHSQEDVKALRESGRPEKLVRSGAEILCMLLLREAGHK